MSSFEGVILGTRPLDRAIRIAGALAELGQTHLLISTPLAPPTPLTPRTTNLPGLLMTALIDAGTVSLDVPALGAQITLSSDTARWTTGDPHAAALLRARFHA